MVLDTSAIIAMLFDEPERESFSRLLADDPTRLVSTATLVEASIVAEAQRGPSAGRELDLLLHRARIDVVPVTESHAELARRAWRRYGKGRHPAALNLGDCFSYALAADTSEPLLYKGTDFAATDIAAAAPG